VKKTRPTLLANFLGNALFLFNPDFDQPRALARKELEILRDRFTDRGDRATARKKGVCGKVSGDVSTVGRVQIPPRTTLAFCVPRKRKQIFQLDRFIFSDDDVCLGIVFMNLAHEFSTSSTGR